jgi:SAM-dependent methyltransferase
MDGVHLEVLHELLSEPGQRLLERATREYEAAAARAGADGRPGSVDTIALGTRLRRDHDPDLVAAALSQVELRRRAAVKLGAVNAARMYFTPDALEQATPAPVARHRAERMAATLGPARLLDLGCGVGSDLLAAARAGLQVVGVEVDPVRAAMARANLAALGLTGEVLETDASQVDPSQFAVVFADPSRRNARGRVFDPAAYSPPWSFAQTLLTSHTACVKISPAIPHRSVPVGVEAEWVSLSGEVKEAALWSGDLVTARRRATVLPEGATIAARLPAAPSPAGVRPAVPVPAGRPAGYLYEPDGAVIRAGLVADLAELLGARLLDPKIAYLTADEARPTALARCFTVVAELPYREKALRAALRERDIGPLTLKKRGVDVVPEVLRRRLALRGTRAATVVLTRVGGSATALLVEPAAPDPATRP